MHYPARKLSELEKRICELVEQRTDATVTSRWQAVESAMEEALKEMRRALIALHVEPQTATTPGLVEQVGALLAGNGATLAQVRDDENSPLRALATALIAQRDAEERYVETAFTYLQATQAGIIQNVEHVSFRAAFEYATRLLVQGKGNVDALAEAVAALANSATADTLIERVMNEYYELINALLQVAADEHGAAASGTTQAEA